MATKSDSTGKRLAAAAKRLNTQVKRDGGPNATKAETGIAILRNRARPQGNQ